LSNQLVAIYFNRILVLLILFSHAALAMEPVSLGHGGGGQVVNLDRGAVGSAVVVPFMSSGFAAPVAPQSMELDPGALVHQSQQIRDESAAIFQETYRLLNQTIALVAEAEEAERGAMGWANESQQSANRSFEHQQDAQSLYEKAQSSLRRLDLLSRMLIYAEISQEAEHAQDAHAAEAMQQEIIDLSRRISLLEERISGQDKGSANGGSNLSVKGSG
jgi:hypothetical protein